MSHTRTITRAATKLVAASNGLLVALAVGATIGPTLTGWIMDLIGPADFLVQFAAIQAAMAVFALYRRSRSTAPVLEDHAAQWPLHGSTGELAESWVERATEEIKSTRLGANGHRDETY